MSAMTVDEMQARLDALMIVLQVENGDHSIVIEPSDEISDHWCVKVAGWDVGDDTGNPAVTEVVVSTLSFNAPTIGAAVDLAWTHWGHPVECWFCKGEGTFWRWDDAIPADTAGWNVATHHDGRRSAHQDCPTCKGDRVLIPASDATPTQQPTGDPS